MIFLEIIKDWIRDIIYYIKSNLIAYIRITNFLLPYAMLFVGQYVYNERGTFSVGSELVIPFLVYVVMNFIESYANKIGKGTTIPLPSKRFTEVSDDDEVSIEHDRLQELLLYMADLEDHLERKGLL